MENDDITIVTAYYPTNTKKHSAKNYKKWINNFFHIHHKKITVFCPKEIEKIIKENAPDYVVIHVMQLEDTEMYNFCDWEKQKELDPEKHLHCKDLYIIWNNKPFWLKKAIEYNDFGTSKYMWLDIGYIRIPKHVKMIKNTMLVSKLPLDQITLLQVELFKDNEYERKSDGLFLDVPVYMFFRIGAGFISGGKEIILSYYEKYKNMLQHFLDAERFIGKEQTLMSNMVLDEPSLFHIIYSPENDNEVEKWMYMIDYLFT